MTELFASVKADLLDRRLLPLVALVGVCLIAGLAYALLGGGSSSAPSTLGTTAPAGVTAGISVSGTTHEQSVAETTDGSKEQHGGAARNPFTALPGAGGVSGTTTSAASATPASSGSGSSSSGSGASSPTTTTGGSTGGSSGSSGSGSGSGSGETTKPEAKKSKPKQVYLVAVEFGTVPLGTVPGTATLTAYENLKLQTALPSAKAPLIVFRGVTAKGASATFTLVGEAILSGPGACLPSATQCQALDLKPGATEQLSYLEPNGETVLYELRVVAIAAATASTAASKASKASVASLGASTVWAVSKAGREVLRRAGLIALPFLRYSSQPGVLVFAPPKKASAARAHAAARRHSS
ncbi:MAG: hypothetical protein ACLQBB_13765 [Solirubrobacteraceae bacterium]